MAPYETIPYCEIASVLSMLKSLSSRGFGKNYGVEVQLEEIKSNIESLDAVFFDAVEKNQGQQAVQQWIRQLKLVLFAAEDLLDEVTTDNLPVPNSKDEPVLKALSSFFSSKKAADRSGTAREIKDIHVMIKDIMKDKSELPLTQGSQKQSPLFDPNMVIFGREKDKEEIMDLLLKEDESATFIVIVGLGGVGKTTLAQKVFHDERVVGFFPNKVWLDCSKNPKVQDLEQLNINGKARNLLVLDDMWSNDSEVWSKVRSLIGEGAQGIKVLITTRLMNVADVMTGKHVITLNGLSDEDSLNFLLKDENDSMRHDLEPVATEIVKKCAGLPLAIKTLAQMLHQKTKSEWIRLLEGDLWNTGDGRLVFDVLKMSYDHLPRTLKQCFIYCCLYPKGWMVEKDELIQLWMAQGYLQCLNAEKQMEDIGNQFVNDLLSASLFMDEEKDEYGNIVSFKIHDLLHDIACFVAGIDFYVGGQPREEAPVHMSLSMNSYTDYLLDIFHTSKLRTFFLWQANDREIGQKKLSVISRIKGLRALNLSGSSLALLPSSIDELKHLRYLNLSWCLELTTLPKSIGNLAKLLTLKLTGCENLKFSTEVVTKLIKLRHLEIDLCKAFEDMMPTGLAELSSLQSLSNFYVGDDQKKSKAGKLNELQKLNSLRGSLEINSLDKVNDVKGESEHVNMKDKMLLESLSLRWKIGDKIDDNKRRAAIQLLEYLCPHQNLKRLHVWWYPGDEFSKWVSSMNNLSHISLIGFPNCKHLPPLDDIPHLKSLEISFMNALEYIHFKTVSTFFESLKKLKLSSCGKLLGWKCEGREDHTLLPSLQALSELTIIECPKLIFFPAIPNVEKLQLTDTIVKPLIERPDHKEPSPSAPYSKLNSLKMKGEIVDVNILTKCCASLKYLEIGDAAKLEDLFQYDFGSLTKIFLYDCDIKALPENICDLVSLVHIKLLGCQYLASLPERMSKLTKLETLEIYDCPLLVTPCQEETGVEWPKIRHVKNLIIKPNQRG